MLARIKRNTLPFQHAVLNPEYQKYKAYFDLVPDIKTFAENVLGFPQTGSYNTFLPSSGQGHWILSAVRSSVLVPKIWHFPIIGDMPYIGYFKVANLVGEEKGLQKDGFDTYVRTSAAFSGLGYLNMPVVESMMQQGEAAFIETLLHEMTHEAYYLFGATQFNEGLAQFLAERATLEFIHSSSGLHKQLHDYEISLERVKHYRHAILAAWGALLKLLGTDSHATPIEDWKVQKEKIFNVLNQRLQREQLGLSSSPQPKPWNNARIYAEVIYMADHCYFEVLYRNQKFPVLKAFFKWIKLNIPKDNPSQHLRELVGITQECHV